jgi:hypothetical protein
MSVVWQHTTRPAVRNSVRKILIGTVPNKGVFLDEEGHVGDVVTYYPMRLTEQVKYDEYLLKLSDAAKSFWEQYQVTIERNKKEYVGVPASWYRSVMSNKVFQNLEKTQSVFEGGAVTTSNGDCTGNGHFINEPIEETDRPNCFLDVSHVKYTNKLIDGDCVVLVPVQLVANVSADEQLFWCYGHGYARKYATHASCELPPATADCYPTYPYASRLDFKYEHSGSVTRHTDLEPVGGAWVEVKASGYPGHNGRGLFASKNFNKDELIGSYCGTAAQIGSPHDKAERADISNGGRFRLWLDQSNYISGYNCTHGNALPGKPTEDDKRNSKPDAMLPLANHSETKANAAFVQNSRGNTRCVLATRTINIGDEILIDYGTSHVH